MVAGGPVVWSSKKQSTQAHSSCEAEYMALDAGLREVMWVREFLGELGVPFEQPVEIFVDNQGAQAIAKNPVAHERTKHIGVRFHYIRDQI